MKSITHKIIYAAFLGISLASAPLTAFAQQGPRPSSYDNWPGMTNTTAPASETAVTAFDGTRPSLDNWRGMTGTVDSVGVSSADPSFAGPRPSPNH